MSRRRGSLRSDVRYWPKADICSCTAHVRFRGQSGSTRAADQSRFMSTRPRGLLCAKSGLMHHSNQLFDHLVVRPCAFAVLTLRGAVKSIIIEQKQQVAANQCDWPSKAKSRLPQGENKLGSKSLFRARRIHTARKTEWSTPCRFTRTASSNESCHS
jgi:hypothetical protein